MINPKLFVSYHPSGKGVEEFVLRIAEDLRERGVDVVLDKWDLPRGLDPHDFVSEMVSEPKVKVAIISDRRYAESAGQPFGGALPIIHQKLYDAQPGEKFALVITERDENGEPFVPAYYRHGVVIDMCGPGKESEGFDALVRWTYGKPLLAKPPLGPEPDFSLPEISLGTGLVHRQAIDAVKNQRSTTAGRIDEYLRMFEENLERFRIIDFEIETDQAVYDSINAFKPFRDEYIRFLFAVAGYRPAADFAGRIQRFFERLVSYTRPPDHRSRHSDSDLDNFLFIVHELFLYTIAIFLKYEMFPEVNQLLTEKYYLAGKAELGQEEFITFDGFHQHIESLEKFSQRAGLGHEAIRANMIKDRSAGTGLDLRDLMQADFTIFLRAEVNSQPYYSQWWPETLMFLGHFRGAFEIFARAKSRDYFERMKIVIGIERPVDLIKLLTSYEEEMRQLPRGLTRRSPANLSGFELLASLP